MQNRTGIVGSVKDSPKSCSVGTKLVHSFRVYTAVSEKIEHCISLELTNQDVIRSNHVTSKEQSYHIKRPQMHPNPNRCYEWMMHWGIEILLLCFCLVDKVALAVLEACADFMPPIVIIENVQKVLETRSLTQPFGTWVDPTPEPTTSIPGHRHETLEDLVPWRVNQAVSAPHCFKNLLQVC